MEIEIGLTNGPLLGFSLNYADEEYPYDEMVFYFLFAHITFRWIMYLCKKKDNNCSLARTKINSNTNSNICSYTRHKQTNGKQKGRV